MEILRRLESAPPLRAALFDFDGTLSTLRHGWERIMEPLMLEWIAGPGEPDEALRQEVAAYIDHSTGMQTIFQMQWIAARVKAEGRNPQASEDPWWYKAAYNRRLMDMVEERAEALRSGSRPLGDFLVPGGQAFLEALASRGIDLYVASGTDHPDVVREAGILGMGRYFKEIAGAPPGRMDCSKEAVLRRLVGENGLSGAEVVVIGDGRVEIALGRELGARTLGIASDEEHGGPMDLVKRERLVRAGADAVVGDFREKDAILAWLASGSLPERWTS